MITIQSREKQSDRRATCFRAKGTQCDSPGQRPGKMRNECSKPQRGEMTVPPITPFQGFNVRNCRFLGRCPRLSHDAALRQDPSETRSVVTEQKPDQQATPNQRNFCAAQSHPTIPIKSQPLCESYASFAHSQTLHFRPNCRNCKVLPPSCDRNLA